MERSFGGDHQYISETIVLNEEQYKQAVESIRNGKKGNIPHNWDEYEWEEAIKMVEKGCKPNVKYFKLIKEDWDDNPSFYEERSSAESDVLDIIYEQAGDDIYSSVEYWEDMDIKDLKYWLEIIENDFQNQSSH